RASTRDFFGAPTVARARAIASRCCWAKKPERKSQPMEDWNAAVRWAWQPSWRAARICMESPLLFQDFALRSLEDKSDNIFVEHQTILLQSDCCAGDFLHVTLVISVHLFQRGTRIACFTALHIRPKEWHRHAIQIAQMSCREFGRTGVPAGECRNRCLDQ